MSQFPKRMLQTVSRFFDTGKFYARSLLKKMIEADILFLASGLAFNGILTMIPLLLLSASALGSFLNSSQLAVSQLNQILNAIFPPQPFATSIKQTILTAASDLIAYRRSLGLIGVLVLVWSGTSLFDALRSVLHTIYRLERTKTLLVSLAHHVGFVFLVFLLFLVSSVSMWALSLLENLVSNTPVLSSLTLPKVHETLPTVVITALTAFMFYIIYRYIPDSKPPRAAGMMSTITTTTLWVISAQLFAVYLRNFSAIGRIYGSYAFVLVLLIWVYYSSIIFIVGAIVGQIYWERVKARDQGNSRLRISSP